MPKSYIYETFFIYVMHNVTGEFIDVMEELEENDPLNPSSMVV